VLKEYRTLVDKAQDLTPKGMSLPFVCDLLSEQFHAHHYLVWGNLLPKLQPLLELGRRLRLKEEDRLRTEDRKEEIKAFYEQFISSQSSPINPENTFPYFKYFYAVPQVADHLLKDNTVVVTQEMWEEHLEEIKREVVELQFRIREELVRWLVEAGDNSATNAGRIQDNTGTLGAEQMDSSNAATKEVILEGLRQIDPQHSTALSYATALFCCKGCRCSALAYTNLLAHATSCRNFSYRSSETIAKDFCLDVRGRKYAERVVEELAIKDATHQEMESFRFVCLRCRPLHPTPPRLFSWAALVH
jgi:hypothetical protein